MPDSPTTYAYYIEQVKAGELAWPVEPHCKYARVAAGDDAPFNFGSTNVPIDVCVPIGGTHAIFTCNDSAHINAHSFGKDQDCNGEGQPMKIGYDEIISGFHENKKKCDDRERTCKMPDDFFIFRYTHCDYTFRPDGADWELLWTHCQDTNLKGDAQSERFECENGTITQTKYSATEDCTGEFIPETTKPDECKDWEMIYGDDKLKFETRGCSGTGRMGGLVMVGLMTIISVFVAGA